MESIPALFREPVITFVVLLAVILVIPPIFERLRLPGLVGLLVAGVVLGTSGLHVLSNESEIMKLFADIGKIYLMFVAGLEIDLAQFRRTRNRSLSFGGTTFAIPLIAGLLVGRLFGFDWNASVLIGSLLASHTLLAYPIVQRLGVVHDEAVAVTIGATIFTDIGALLVLAICTGVNRGDFSALSLITLVGGLGLYAAAVLFGLDWLGKDFFRRSRDDQGNQFLFVLLAVFLASVGAQLVGVEKIVGAFLAGLAVNDVVGNSPVKEKVEFVGSVLFIPIFFVSMGLLLDIHAFRDLLTSIGLPLAIVAALGISKFLAAWAMKPVGHYSWAQTLTMWSLSLPQVAATLAAALVGYEANIINQEVFSSVILLMLVTAVVGPLITTRAATQLAQALPPIPALEDGLSGWLEASELTQSTTDFTVVVPVYNPKTEQSLLEMAALLTRHQGGTIVPLAIARAQSHMASPQLARSLQRCQRLLTAAQETCLTLGVTANPKLRIEYDVAQGISHLSREVEANLVLLGLGSHLGFRAQLLGNITDQVLGASHCLVAIARLQQSPLACQKILVPVENFTTATLQAVYFAQGLAVANQAQLTFLHICLPHTPRAQKDWAREQLALMVKGLTLPKALVRVQVVVAKEVISKILRESQKQDLVVLRSRRQRVGADGLPISEVTFPLLQRLTCSVVLLGDAQESVG
jgi:Kef-type K+ transport system membrane component KefB/nucleotide-binding universal stress UspA family protein